LSLVTVALTSFLGIACGAQVSNNGQTPQSGPATASAPDLGSIAASVNGTGAASPQLQAAIDRVTKAKADLENARKRLNASKAILKAADAEFKAAKADQQALALRGQAQELADASGMNGPQTTAPATSIAQPAQIQQPGGADQTVDNSGQGFDFSGTSFTGVPTPGK